MREGDIVYKEDKPLCYQTLCSCWRSLIDEMLASGELKYPWEEEAEEAGALGLRDIGKALEEI